jgi:hypothetical protein
MENWHRLLGVRPRETKTVGLFFAHNFLLGIGTILVYVAANVLLLDNHPERNLPLAYGVGSLAMVGVGRLYAYYEHHLLLRQLAGRALLAAAVLTLVLGLLLWLGPSVTVAVAIMTGYRLIYLLTHLEFWGMSAVVFNVRQGRRLFGVISAGDLPAKALGAVLAVFVHATSALYGLLLTAFASYLVALLLQRATFRAQVVEAHQASRPAAPASLGAHLLGGSRLVRAMGLSLLALAAVAVGVEYLFFLNVKYKLQAQASILQYVGGLLALTYLLAMLFKLLFARFGLDRLGMRWSLLLLPLAALAGVGLFGGLQLGHVGLAGQIAYFGGLYLGLEVLRRAVFEPVFLVLFQPLTPAERLAGHTLVKGFYEPLGLGLGGLLLLALPQLPGVPLMWMAGLLLLAVFLLRRTYWRYLDELKGALGLRFAQSPTPSLLLDAQITAMPASSGAKKALFAIEQLRRAGSRALITHADTLLKHPSSHVRSHVLALLGPQATTPLLRQLVLTDPDPTLREQASRLACHQPGTDDLLHHSDMAVCKGAIQGRLAAAPTDALAQARLTSLAASDERSARLAALALITLLPPQQQATLVITSLTSAELPLVQAAVQAAAKAPSRPLAEQLIALLRTKPVQQPAADALVQLGETALPPLQTALAQETDTRRLQTLAQVCARVATLPARQLLVALAQGDNLPRRAAALRALSSFATVPTDTPLFQHLVQEEMQFAQHLLHGMLAATTELRTALHYELRKAQQRLFGLLLHVYERQPMLDAQRGVAHTTGERQANALEILDNLIPRPLYRGLQAMLDVGRLQDKVQTFEDLLGPASAAEPIVTAIVRRGAAAFSAWTISVALGQWHPQPATVAYLYPHLQASDLLIQESALAVLRQLPTLRPAAYDQLLALHPDLDQLLATMAAGPTPCSSARERVRLLKGTALFADTPENVLATILPIMREVAFGPDTEIFAKGALGTSLFIICSGEVGIFDGPRQLTTFRKGDFFGELALLDAEARSATAVALGPVVAFRLDQDDFYDVLEECTEVVRNILRVLCQRLRRQNELRQALA